MPDRLNKTRLGFSTDGDTVEILASYSTETNKVKIHFYAPDLDRSGDICLEFNEAWHFANDVISSALKVNPHFIPRLFADLGERLRLLEEKQQEMLDR